MELKDIVAIQGLPGLHKIVGKRPNGMIVETIDAQAKRFPTNLTQKISILEEIAMFTSDGEEKLINVFKKAQEAESKGIQVPNKKSDDNVIKNYFKEILPNYDEDRVYVSDMKKFVNWFSILKSHIDFSKIEEKNTEENENIGDIKNAKSTVVAPKIDQKVKADTKAKSSGAAVKRSSNRGK